MPAPLTDRHDRVHRSLRISIVDKCDLRCTYCMPEDQQFLRREELMTRAEIAHIAQLFVQRHGITKIGSPAANRCCGPMWWTSSATCMRWA